MDDRWLDPFRTSIRVVRVSRATGEECGVVANVRPGGSITRNLDTDTYESAQLEYEGSWDVGADLVRVYLDATFYRTGETASEPLGTFLSDAPSRDVDGALASGTATLDGRLAELADDAFEDAHTVAAGADPVAAAAAIARGCGLEVVADPTAYRLAEARTYGLGDDESKLSVVNDLLSLAGFSAARTDPMGRVLMRRYVEPADKAPAWAFEEGPLARFESEATDELDGSEVANVVLAIFETTDETVVGTAVDDDPASRWGVPALGRRKVARYRYDELPEGPTAQAREAAADAKAAEVLRTQQSAVHRVTLSGIYAPASCGDVVSVEYPSAGISGRFAVRTEDIDLSAAGCLTKYEVREFTRGEA